MHWLLELEVFAGAQALASAARRAGHQVSTWTDESWSTRRFPVESPDRVLFHGSLGNAACIRRELPWMPGAFCDDIALSCSTWMRHAKPWALNGGIRRTTVRELVASRDAVRAELGNEVFVRPDSPLKAFSGRVVRLEGLTPAQLDHDYYYDDLDLPVVVAPLQSVGAEWRFVVVERAVIAGSAYEASARSALEPVTGGAAWRFAEEVATRMPPEPVYVLDICETPSGFRLIELNPFSGSDLYRCDPDAIVRAVASVVDRRR